MLTGLRKRPSPSSAPGWGNSGRLLDIHGCRRRRVRADDGPLESAPCRTVSGFCWHRKRRASSRCRLRAGVARGCSRAALRDRACARRRFLGCLHQTRSATRSAPSHRVRRRRCMRDDVSGPQLRSRPVTADAAFRPPAGSGDCRDAARREARRGGWRGGVGCARRLCCQSDVFRYRRGARPRGGEAACAQLHAADDAARRVGQGMDRAGLQMCSRRR